MADKHTITKSGLELLKKELEEKLQKRDSLKNAIEEMRDRGDLSENDGYSLALDDNESNERRIAELESLIEKAKIVKETDDKSVSVGNKVEVESNGQKSSFTIVGESEADPLANKISIGSPLGSALKGKKVGDSIKVELPRGAVEYKIISLS